MALRHCMRTLMSATAGRGSSLRGATRSSRLLSTAPTSDVIVEMDEKKGVATLKLNKGPVNSLNLEYLRDIIQTVDALEKEKGVRGLIITSALPGLFCAGLDVTEMYQPNAERLRQFWHHVQEIWLRIYGSKLLVMSAINGHSPAGGCLMSVTPDFRVMADGKYRIGLNETLLGMVAPQWFQKTLINTIGHREAEKALQLGHLFTSREAHQVGLVDAVAPEENVMDVTWAEMDKWLKIPDLARQRTKLSMRSPTIKWMLERRQDDSDFFFNLLTHETTQRNIGYYLESLKKPKKKAQKQ